MPCDWLCSLTSSITENVEFHENNLSVSEAVVVCWTLRGVLRSWGVRCGEDLTCWFRATREPFYGEERVLQQASAVDARVALLESVFVTVALHMGRQEHVESDVPATGPTRAAPGTRGRFPIAGPVPPACWESLDSVKRRLLGARSSSEELPIS